MRCLHLSGFVCGTAITSCDVSRNPSPVLPPTSMNDANLDHTTHVSAW